MSEYAALLSKMMDALLAGETKQAASLFTDKENLPPAKQLAVYTDAYHIRLHGVLLGAYPALAHFMDREPFHTLVGKYISQLSCF